MLDARKLLDQFLGAGSGAQAGDMLGQLQRGAGGMLGNLQRGGAGEMLGQLQKGAAENPLAAKVIAGGLAAILLKSGGRGLTGSAVKLGGLGLIGALAYKAYQDWQAKQAGQLPPGQAAGAAGGEPKIASAPENSAFIPAGNEAEERARLLVTAMISAAKADGHIDAGEQKRIFERLSSANLDTESKAYVMDQLQAPLDLDGLVRSASGPEVATEIYAASLLAIDPDHPAEKAYLQMLAARLALAEDLVKEIHRTAEAAQIPA